MLKSNLETFATMKLINGENITCDYVGNSFGDLNTIYYFHSHGADIDCPPDCQRINLKTLLEAEYKDYDQYSSVFISSVFLKLRALIEQIVRNPNFGLYTESYFFTVAFDAIGNAFIHGCLWPQSLENYHRILHDMSYGCHDDESAPILYENFVSRNFSRSSDIASIKQQFDLNDVETEALVEKVRSYQIDLDMDPFIPSLETFHDKEIKDVAKENFVQANGLMMHMKELLQNLDEQSKRSLSTKDWLRQVELNVSVRWNEFFNFVSLTLETSKYEFHKDSLLMKKICEYSKEGTPFLGYFQYCRMLIGGEKDSLIIATKYVIESFTYEYNPIILKAVESSTSVFPINGSFDWNLFDGTNGNNLVHLGIDQSILNSHQEVNLNEMVYKIDTNKCKIFSNPPNIFVNTNPDRKSLFQKTNEENDFTYEADDNSGYYEPLYDIVSRHQSRKNGQKLLLCETSTMFDLLSNSDSLELMSCLELENIPNSEIFSNITQTLLPQYIFCGTNQVLKIRTKCKKILCFPSYKVGSEDWAFNRVLLYYPLKPNEQLTRDRATFLINEMSSIDESLSVVDFNEKCFFDKKIKPEVEDI